MASVFSHAIAASAISSAFYRAGVPKRVWIMGIACSVLPDLDVIGFRFGIHYSDFWGHRGFTHSLIFAVILAGLTAVAIPQRAFETHRRFLFVYISLATASHGLLDAMTNGGLGVAFFSPFDNRRYFLPWRPIRVSPIGISRFFTATDLPSFGPKSCGYGFLRCCSYC
jgi:inner membrane protein